jgi:hypothetical protein
LLECFIPAGLAALSPLSEHYIWISTDQCDCTMIRKCIASKDETLTRTTTEHRHPAVKSPSWMLVNSESVSNEINESELRCYKNNE